MLRIYQHGFTIVKQFKTWRYGEKDNNNQKWPHTFLSTIDSAWRLFEEGKVDPDNTIVIVDETHTFLQTARKDFDKTARAIEEAGCPVIGFTATKSYWVLEYIFRIDTEIRITATDLSPKVVVPVMVKVGIPATIAEMIRINGWKKVVIWTEIIGDQNRIEQKSKRYILI